MQPARRDRHCAPPRGGVVHRIASALVAAVLGAGVAAAQDRPIAFTKADLVPISGPPIAGGTLVVIGGTIAAVGPAAAGIGSKPPLLLVPSH